MQQPHPHIMSHSTVFELKNLISYSDASTVSKVVSRNSNGNITLFAFDKGQVLSEHTAPFDATVVVVEGECRITINGVENRLTEGQMIIMPANIPHALEAVEQFKMLLIMIKKS
jgi:quercetin dioxygenase-like cupin family protein